MSLAGICIPTGELIGAGILSGLKRDGCHGVRQIAPGASPSKAWSLANEIIEHGLQPYLMVDYAEQMIALPHESPVLVGYKNEPDLAGISPAAYAVRAVSIVQMAADLGLRVYLGEVSNLNPRGFDYLAALPWSRWPTNVVGCSFHRYPETSGFQTPHKGCGSRVEEIGKLRRIVGDRSIICSEIGYNNLDFTEEQSADYMSQERAFANEQGMDWIFAYSLIDGPDPTNVEHRYGFLRTDNSKKPVYDRYFAGVV